MGFKPMKFSVSLDLKLKKASKNPDWEFAAVGARGSSVPFPQVTRGHAASQPLPPAQRNVS